MDVSTERWIRTRSGGGPSDAVDRQEGVRRGSDGVRCRHLVLPFTLLVSVVLAGPSALHGQSCGGSHLSTSPGVTFPANGEELSQAHAAYLRAWNADAPERLLALLASEVRGLVRTELLDAQDLRALLELAVPELNLEACSVFLVEDVGEWVSVGTYVQVGSKAGTPQERVTGTMTTVWTQGSDLQWRVVFVSALWLGAEPRPLPAVAGGPSRH
jgi:hypothetical protein